jgi:hypothetical protein
LLLHPARAEGVGPGRLPDFLGLEQGGELALLGQDELDLSVLEESLREQLERDAGVHRVALAPDAEPGAWRWQASGIEALGWRQ